MGASSRGAWVHSQALPAPLAVLLLLLAVLAAALVVALAGGGGMPRQAALSLLAIWLYHEPFSPTRGVGFALIWLGLAVYSAESLWRYRQDQVQSAAPT